MTQVLIVGYGNPLRGDDGLGWTVAAELFRQNQSQEFEVLPCHQLTPELASNMQAVEVVVFVDCARDGVPGEFRCIEVQPEADPSAFTHDLTPAGLLSLTCELFGVCPRTYLLSICGARFGTGESLSPEVARSLPQLKKALGQLMDRGCAHLAAS